MGPPTYIQNSCTKSDHRPSTRSTTDAATASTSAQQSHHHSSTTTGTPHRSLLQSKNCGTSSNGKSSSIKRPRPPSPNKRHSRARKSLNFDEEPVSSKGTSTLPNYAEFDLSLNNRSPESEGEIPSLRENRLKASSNDDTNLPPPQQPLPSLTDLMSSYAKNTRRSQRITLKRLEEGQTSLKDVEAGPGPSVCFNIPLIPSSSQTIDQSSDYGTASERSFIHSQSQECRSRPSDSASSEEDSKKTMSLNYTRRRRRSRNSKNEKPLSPPKISPSYHHCDDSEDSLSDAGYLEPDATLTSSSQGFWDDDPNLACLPSHRNEWDQQIEEEENSQHSICSDSSYNNYPPCALTSARIISHRKVHLLVPLEGYELPPSSRSESSGITTRCTTRSQSILSNHHSFYLNEHESRLYKRRRRLLPQPELPDSPFTVETYSNIYHEDSFLQDYGLKVVVASPVICLRPFGTKFAPTFPAVVSIPLDVDPAKGDEFYCLYSKEPAFWSPESSGKLQHSQFDWHVLENDENENCHNSQLSYKDGRVTFEISECCYLLIIIRNKFCDVEMVKPIRARIGGKMYLPSKNLDLVRVNFPKGSLEKDVEARVKLFFDTEMNLIDFFKKKPLNTSKSALASPIIMIEPHGLIFNEVNSSQGVTVQLPIPDYEYIMSHFSHLKPQLTLWQSCTTENEECKWERLDRPFNISKIPYGRHTETVITFQVQHFSFFRAVWNLISAGLYEARVGMSYLYPYVCFSMKCQANMQENTDTKRFGLEVICYRSDKVLPEITNYPHRVGCCTKPKLVKPGRIIIRLKSRFFEQDVEAGEDDNGMVKEEADFRGRDFEMQYALRFKEGMTVGKGTFGKVIVKRFIRAGDEEPLFEFNLQKSGCEGEQTPHDYHSDRWSVLALQELAGNLFITADNNWKRFAKEIGFTQKEIKYKLKPAQDPFIAMLNMYQARGGTPNEFVTALYSVNRQLKLGGGASPTGSKKSISSHSSSGLGSSADRYGESSDDSDTSGTQISQDSLLNGSTRKRSNPSIQRSGSGSAGSKNKRPRRHAHKLPPQQHKPIHKKKHSTDESGGGSDGEDDNDDDDDDPEDRESLASDNESVKSGSGKVDVNIGVKAMSDSSSLLHNRDQTKLGTTYLWELSANLDTLTWKNLARTLGLDEPSILNIEHLHKTNGFRECAYQMLIFWKERYPKRCTYGVLYQALCKEGMNAVAKKMKFVTRND